MTYEIKIPPKHSGPVTPEDTEDCQVPAQQPQHKRTSTNKSYLRLN